MIITADTICYAVMILFIFTVTHAVAYLEGWQRGSREGLKKDLRAFISREEIDKAVDEIIKEREGMSKCRYDLSEDCNNTDCLNCVLDKIRAEIERIEICGQIDGHSAFIRSGENVKTMALDIIEKYKAESEEV